jgi:pimeloyl-ACP methyl ester carboxylesterase
MTARCLPAAFALAAFAVLAGCALPQAPSAPPVASVPPATALPTYAGAEPLGAAMEGWAYPYPVQMLQFEQEGRLLRMAYMDVQPAQPNGQTVVLMHGKNFAGDYWAETLRVLAAQGYRVIAPDQIGFGKSSKPEMRYTFAMLADNTVRLLDHLKVSRVAIVANSMGGMLGVHFARRHPERVSALVLENPLGLEDYVLSIPPQQTPNLVKLEMAQTPASYRSFVRSYFPASYKPAYERFVEQFARVQLSAEYPRFATVSALTYQMIYDGPIYDELPRLTVPTLLAIGQLDRTVFGRRFAPPEVVQPLGNYPVLGKTAQQRIPGAQLVAFDGVGHVPHLDVPERFHSAVLAFLADLR